MGVARLSVERVQVFSNAFCATRVLDLPVW
jgi:hypothetical protein